MKKLLFSLTICMLLVSCLPTKRNIDLFNDTTCAVPCVLGITPGLTSEADAQAIIKTNDSLLNCQKQEFQLPTGNGYLSKCNNPDESFILYFQDGTVDHISFSQTNLSIKQVIQKYGTPDVVKVHRLSSARLMMALQYFKIRLQVILFSMDGQEYEVKPTTLVSIMDFYSEHGFNRWQKLLEDKWIGYGIYQVSQQ